MKLIKGKVYRIRNLYLDEVVLITKAVHYICEDSYSEYKGVILIVNKGSAGAGQLWRCTSKYISKVHLNQEHYKNNGYFERFNK